MGGRRIGHDEKTEGCLLLRSIPLRGNEWNSSERERGHLSPPGDVNGQKSGLRGHGGIEYTLEGILFFFLIGLIKFFRLFVIV